MTPRLRDVVFQQRKQILGLIDRVESAPTAAAIGKLRGALLAQLAAEEEVLLPLTAGTSIGASYGGELHAVLRFVLERISAPDASREERAARLRVLRDMLVHQAERDEHVMVELVEAKIGVRAAATAARRFVKALGASVEDVAQRAPRKPALVEGRRTGR